MNNWAQKTMHASFKHTKYLIPLQICAQNSRSMGVRRMSFWKKKDYNYYIKISLSLICLTVIDIIIVFMDYDWIYMHIDVNQKQIKISSCTKKFCTILITSFKNLLHLVMTRRNSLPADHNIFSGSTTFVAICNWARIYS